MPSHKPLYLALNRTRIQACPQTTSHQALRHHRSRPSRNDEGQAKTLKTTRKTPVRGARPMFHALLATATSARDISGRRVKGARCVPMQSIHMMPLPRRR
jgi:hypothetical protein